MTKKSPKRRDKRAERIAEYPLVYDHVGYSVLIFRNDGTRFFSSKGASAAFHWKIKDARLHRKELLEHSFKCKVVKVRITMRELTRKPKEK